MWLPTILRARMAKKKWKGSLAIVESGDGADGINSFALPLTGGESYPLAVTPLPPPPNYSAYTPPPAHASTHTPSARRYNPDTGVWEVTTPNTADDC